MSETPAPEIVRDPDAPDRFSGDWWQDLLLNIPLRLVILLVLALVARYLLHRLIDRVVKGMGAGRPTRFLGSIPAANVVARNAERRTMRAKTIGSLLKSVVTALIGTVAAVMALDIIGYSIGPLLASAGIVGLAIGFGAQNLVKDLVSGAAMLMEDQFGVGDVIDMGEASGTVEAVGIRITRLRAFDGTLWYVRNGEVLRVGNSSQDWSQARVDIRVAYGTDIDRAREVLEEAAAVVAGSPEWQPKIIDQPSVTGVESLATDAVVLRIVAKTVAQQQWGVARALRARAVDALVDAGIEIPLTDPRLPPPPSG